LGKILPATAAKYRQGEKGQIRRLSHRFRL
jgi:hypothetical protein